MREQRITNRPLLTTPERQCLSCGRGFRAAWGWVFLQDGGVIDLDGHCARRLRYCGADERQELIAKINVMIKRKEGRVAV